MEALFLLGLLLALCYWTYRAGKRTGSRKGFGAGRRRGRHRR